MLSGYARFESKTDINPLSLQYRPSPNPNVRFGSQADFPRLAIGCLLRKGRSRLEADVGILVRFGRRFPADAPEMRAAHRRLPQAPTGTGTSFLGKLPSIHLLKKTSRFFLLARCIACSKSAVVTDLPW